MVSNYLPDVGDLVWVNFNPSKGSEQRGRRPAVVVTNSKYNKFGLCYVMPITSAVKGYAVEISLPATLSTSGVILTNQMMAMDWRARNMEYIETLPPMTFALVKSRLRTILQLWSNPL